MKKIARSTIKSRQILLEGILKDELEILKKKVFPRQNRNLLEFVVKIEEWDFNNDTTEGQYIKILNENDKNEYTHLIRIRKQIIYSVQKSSTDYLRKGHYKLLKSVIRHELVHAFVEERYEDIGNIKEKNADASPIFLAILYYLKGRSGHECARKFKHTDAFHESFLMCNTFKEVDEYVIQSIFKYRNITTKLATLINEEDFLNRKTNNLIQIVNDFEFASREVGLNKISEVSLENNIKVADGGYKKSTIIFRTWSIGCNISPEILEKLYNKKQDCKAKYYKHTKNLCLYSGDIIDRNIIISEVKNINLK